MMCQDCVAESVHRPDRHIGKAEWLLIDYDSLRLLCQECYDKYCYAEGEVNLDFHFLKLDLEQAFKRTSEILEYHTKKYSMLLKENSELKKKTEKLEAIMKQVVEPTLKESKEYLDTHDKPEPHNVEMSRYWLEKGFYGTILDLEEDSGG